MQISVKHLKTNVDKFRGFMFRDNLENVYFETRCGIHTFFLRQNIDVIILNDNYEVVRMKQNLDPRRIFIWNPKYQKVLETKAGFIKDNKIRFKQKIDLKFVS